MNSRLPPDTLKYRYARRSIEFRNRKTVPKLPAICGGEGVRSVNLTSQNGRDEAREGRRGMSFKSRRRPADLCAGSSTCSISGAEQTNVASFLGRVESGASRKGRARILRFRYDAPCLDRSAPDRIRISVRSRFSINKQCERSRIT